MTWNRIIVWDHQQEEYLKQFCPNATYIKIGAIDFTGIKHKYFSSNKHKTKRLSRAHKIDILREEVLAWEAGKDIARDFGIPIDNKLWHSMTCSALFKYVNWCIDA